MGKTGVRPEWSEVGNRFSGGLAEPGILGTKVSIKVAAKNVHCKIWYLWFRILRNLCKLHKKSHKNPFDN